MATRGTPAWYRDRRDPPTLSGEERERTRRAMAEGERDRIVGLLRAVSAELDEDAPNAPGHSHEVPGVWDDDNGELAGQRCTWCWTWTCIRDVLKKYPA